MISTRTTLVAAVIAVALSGCGANTPTAAPPAPPSAFASTPTTTDTPAATVDPTVAPPPSTTDTPTVDPAAPPQATTDTPTVDPTTPAPPPTAPPVDPTVPAPPPFTHTPAAPSIPAQPTVPVTHAPSPASLPPAPNPEPAPVGTPAPPVAPAPPRPAPVVQAPPATPARVAPAPAISSWSGIYDAFVASHPGPTYRVADTGNYGNTTTDGSGTMVVVSIAPRTPASILYSVMAHEYGHFRQNHAYGPGLGYAVRAVGSVDLDHAADCFALAHGATWVNYGCTDTPQVRGILARMGG